MAPAEESDTWLEASRRFHADCCDTELRTFINAKKGSADDTHQRAELLQKLETLDRDAVFRLVDLPKELRLMIFRRLLVKEKGTDKKIWPTIMAVSKLVNRETEEVVYCEQPLVVVHRFPYYRDPTEYYYYEVQSDLMNHKWDDGHWPCLRTLVRFYRPWMSVLAKFKHTVFQMIGSKNMLFETRHDLRDITGNFHAIASLLAVMDSKVQKITVQDCDAGMRSHCWPLSTLTEVEVNFVGAADQQQEQEDWSDADPLALPEWWKLKAKVENHLRLLRAAELQPPGLKLITLQLKAFEDMAILTDGLRGQQRPLKYDFARLEAYLHGEKMSNARTEAAAKLAQEGRAVPRLVTALELASEM